MRTYRPHNRPRRLARLALALGVTLGSLALIPPRPLFATTGGHFTFFPVTCIGFPNLCATQGIVTGSDNNLWFTEPNTVVGRITLSGTVTQRFLPNSIGTADAAWITAGPDGNLWVTLNDVIHGQSAVARITPHFGMTVFPIPSQHGLATEAEGITTGPDGNLWVADPLGRIYRVTITGTVTTFNTGVNTNPTMITSGPDGNLWFTDSANARIGRITPGGQITFFAVLAPTLLRPVAITAGPDGALWFVCEGRGNMIGRITTAGAVTLFPLPNPSSAHCPRRNHRGTRWRAVVHGEYQRRVVPGSRHHGG